MKKEERKEGKKKRRGGKIYVLMRTRERKERKKFVGGAKRGKSLYGGASEKSPLADSAAGSNPWPADAAIGQRVPHPTQNLHSGDSFGRRLTGGGLMPLHSLVRTMPVNFNSANPPTEKFFIRDFLWILHAIISSFLPLHVDVDYKTGHQRSKWWPSLSGCCTCLH